jgi:hypothetical protein
MKAGVLLFIFADIVSLLKSRGLVSEVGEFGDFSNVEKDLEFVAGVEAILKLHGIMTPDRVDKIIQILPLVASLVR